MTIAYDSSPVATTTSIKGLSILVCIKDSIRGSNQVMGRLALSSPIDASVPLKGPSTYQMNVTKTPSDTPIYYVILHSAPEKLHVLVAIFKGLDPNISFQNAFLDQSVIPDITGTAVYIDQSILTNNLFTMISEEIPTDLLGISFFYGVPGVTTGPQIDGNTLGFTNGEKIAYRWATFAGYEDPTIQKQVIYGLRVKLGNSLTFGSTENMSLYRFVVDPTTLVLEEGPTLVTSDVPFEPHTVKLIRYTDTKGKKTTRLIALGKCQPEKYANNLDSKLLEVLQGRTVAYGLSQLNSSGIWYTDDIENGTGWKRLCNPEISDIEVPSEQGRDFTNGRFQNFDIGMDYDTSWQRIICAGIGLDGSRSAVRGRETFVEP